MAFLVLLRRYRISSMSGDIFLVGPIVFVGFGFKVYLLLLERTFTSNFGCNRSLG